MDAELDAADVTEEEVAEVDTLVSASAGGKGMVDLEVFNSQKMIVYLNKLDGQRLRSFPEAFYPGPDAPPKVRACESF